MLFHAVHAVRAALCRYDKLVGMFSGKEVPAVGVSIGIERVFAIMEAQMRAQAEQVGLGCFSTLPMKMFYGISVRPAAPDASTNPVRPAHVPTHPCAPPVQAGGTIRETETEVLVASIGGGMQQRRMEIASQLWAAGIKVWGADGGG